jgi:ComF family protein
MRDFVANLFFGGVCFVCRGRSQELLCEDCSAELPRLTSELCPRCALPAPGGAVCGRCLAHPPHYDATLAALAYDFPADALVHALKFRGELALAAYLGRLLLQAATAQQPDVVIAVPLSSKRLRERGYNQAVEIARHVMPRRLELGICVRERDSTPQIELPWDARQRNVRGVFNCNASLAGASVAVVDDVMTTGATLDEVARTLKRAGAGRVVNWVVARTLPPS